MLLDGSLAEGSQFELLVGEDPEVGLDPDEVSEPADTPGSDAVDGEVLVIGEDGASPEPGHADDLVNVRAGPKKATRNVEELCGWASVTWATKTTGAEEAFGVSIHTEVPRYSAMVSPWSDCEFTSAPRSTNWPIAESAGFARLATNSGSVVPGRHTP